MVIVGKSGLSEAVMVRGRRSMYGDGSAIHIQDCEFVFLTRVP